MVETGSHVILPDEIVALARDHHRRLQGLQAEARREIRDLSEEIALGGRFRDEMRSIDGPGQFRTHQMRIADVLASAGAADSEEALERYLVDNAGKWVDSGTAHSKREIEAWFSHYGREARPINLQAAAEQVTDSVIRDFPSSMERYGQSMERTIRRRLTSARLRRDSIDDIVGEIQQEVRQVGMGRRFQAERLVRTEMLGAYNRAESAALQAAKEQAVPEMQKTCIVTFDIRTDHDSPPVHYQIRDLDDKFEDGDGRRYDEPPGRPNDREKMIPYMDDPGDEPGQAPAESEATPEPTEPKTDTTQPDPDPIDWPDNLDDFERVERLGGSTGAELVEGPNGRRFVRKRGDSPGHIENEMAADRAYENLGVSVPRHRRYVDDDGDPVKIAEFIEGEELRDVLDRLDDAGREAIYERLRKDFAADAMMANWDVIGENFDNILVAADGRLMRIDNGGALKYRAQGEFKSLEDGLSSFDFHPTDVWTMRHRGWGPDSNSALDVFEDMDWREVRRSFEGIDIEDMVADVPDDVEDVLRARHDEMQEMFTVSDTLMDDRFSEAYTGEFAGHLQGIRSSGVSYRLPNRLEADSLDSPPPDPRQRRFDTNNVVDENGIKFDDIRGRNGLFADFEEYVDDVGGDIRAWEDYASQQARDSWRRNPRAIKHWWQTQARPGGNYFLNGYTEADLAREFERFSRQFGGEEVVDRTFSAHHALTYQILRDVDIAPISGRGSQKTIRLLRTEEREVTSLYGLDFGERANNYTVGPMESTSSYNATYVHGSELMEYEEVPVHRVMGSYLTPRRATDSDGAFLGDGENEFVADLSGVESNYIAKGKPWDDRGDWVEPGTRLVETD